jgi:hypothetical protein
MAVERLYSYSFTLKHDRGTTSVTVIAGKLIFALNRILNSENCPEGAITKIKITPHEPNKGKSLKRS